MSGKQEKNVTSKDKVWSGNFKRTAITAGVTILAIFTLFFIVPLLFGWKIAYHTEVNYNFIAISAIGQWAGALVGFAIPFAIFYLQKRIDDNRKEIGESNSELLNEFEEFKNEYYEKLKILSKRIDDDGNIVFDGGTFEASDSEELYREKLKEKALKFVNISMVTNTQRVSQHLNVSIEETLSLLEELQKHDDAITGVGGDITTDNIDNLTWLKKRKR